MKGKITIYTLTGCPHCLHAKQTLRECNLPMDEVVVDGKPGIRKFLKDYAGKSSLPQIFFNEMLIGGNDDLQTARQDVDKWNELLSILENNEMKTSLMIEDATAPMESPNFEYKKDIYCQTILDFMQEGLTKSLKLSWFGKNLQNCFSGKNFVNWYINSRNTDIDGALCMGNELLGKKLVVGLSSENQLMSSDDDSISFRINDGFDSCSLNVGIPKYCMTKSAVELSKQLRKLTLAMYENFLSQDGKKVDYESMKMSQQFVMYLDVSKNLQHISLNDFGENERTSFFINVYNALVVHSTILNGPPHGLLSRYKFFSSSKYLISGYEFSLNDIENGVLRANKRSPIGLCVPFGSTDKRRDFSFSNVDPRIHFALNCGANSCPPIKTFSAENLDCELQDATEAYLEGDDAVKIVNTNNKPVVHLTSLLKWYASDFGTSQNEILMWVKDHLAEPTKKALLSEVVNKDVKIKYITYDWSSNSA